MYLNHPDYTACAWLCIQDHQFELLSCRGGKGNQYDTPIVCQHFPSTNSLNPQNNVQEETVDGVLQMRKLRLRGELHHGLITRKLQSLDLSPSLSDR